MNVSLGSTDVDKIWQAGLLACGQIVNKNFEKSLKLRISYRNSKFGFLEKYLLRNQINISASGFCSS
jgi:hypothetical protein